MRDDKATFDAAGTAIFGVNPGSPASHEKFTQKLGLPFPLLVDADRSVARDYGCLKENGRSIERTVVLIDRAGVVRKVWKGMPKDAAILEEIGGL